MTNVNLSPTLSPVSASQVCHKDTTENSSIIKYDAIKNTAKLKWACDSFLCYEYINKLICKLSNKGEVSICTHFPGCIAWRLGQLKGIPSGKCYKNTNRQKNAIGVLDINSLFFCVIFPVHMELCFIQILSTFNSGTLPDWLFIKYIVIQTVSVVALIPCQCTLAVESSKPCKSQNDFLIFSRNVTSNTYKQDQYNILWSGLQ